MKNKTQHTPGPWVVNNKWEALTIKNIREMPMRNGTIEETVLEISQGFIPNPKNIALITAAPEMLEALEDCLNEFDKYQQYFPKNAKIEQFMDKLGVILNKAKGEE